MSIRVYSPTKSAVRNRALIVTSGLLLLCTAGAFNMSLQRKGENRGPVMGNAEFGAQFRSPAHFGSPRLLTVDEGVGFRFERRTDDDGEAVLRIRRIIVDADVTPEEVCVHVLRTDMNSATGSWGATLEGVVARLGVANGIEVRHRNNSIIVRGAVLPGNVAYVVSLTLTGSEEDKAIYQQFKRMCRSFQFLSR